MIVTMFLNALWQGALIVALTALVLRLVPAKNATTRYAGWFLALLALIAIPILATVSHVGAQLLATLPHRSAPSTHAFSLVLVGALVNDATKWYAWPQAIEKSWLVIAIVALWFAGGAIGLVRLAVSFIRIAQIRRAATVFSYVDGIPVLTATDLQVPIATGIFSAAIVLPLELARTLSAKDLQCTIEHELAHLRRGDVASNAVQRIIEAVLFWNPWVHLVARRLVGEREAACDDRAVRRIGEPGEYAFCLAALGRRLTAKSALLLTPGAFGSHNALAARIERLMGDRSPGDSNLSYVALGTVAIGFVVMTLAFQAFKPVQVHAASLHASNISGTVAAAQSTCKNPNAEPAALNPVPPQLPHSQWPARKVSAVVQVTIAPSGKATGARVWRSSGDANVDRAVLAAAEKSTYSPKLVNCVAVEGSYLFRADFGP
jgi:TonB family protein